MSVRSQCSPQLTLTLPRRVRSPDRHSKNLLTLSLTLTLILTTKHQTPTLTVTTKHLILTLTLTLTIYLTNYTNYISNPYPNPNQRPPFLKNRYLTLTLTTTSKSPPSITVSMLHSLPSSHSPDADPLPPPSATLPYSAHLYPRLRKST